MELEVLVLLKYMYVISIVQVFYTKLLLGHAYNYVIMSCRILSGQELIITYYCFLRNLKTYFIIFKLQH